MPNRNEAGQALLLVVVALGILSIGAVGLAVDGAQLYAHSQMAQVAADAGAEAGIMSLFDGTNATGANPFGTGAPPGSFTCTTTDGRTPCAYAAKNGFGGTTADVVTVDFPTSAAGVNLSASDPVNLIRVTVQRTVQPGLMKLLGASSSVIRARATAAIVDVVSPVPIIVTHPTLSGSLNSNGNPTIRICGGPRRSIQVNSSSTSSLSLNTNTTVDLTKAGPSDPGDCTTGTGADFGDFGGPGSKPAAISTGSSGKYIQPASPILDPLASVSAPSKPPAAPAPVALANGVSGCPASPPKACNLYSPGWYNAGIDIQNETAVFKPGVYYNTTHGFSNHANGLMVMATGFPADPLTGSGMLVYNTGAGTTFNVGANSSASLVGSDSGTAFKGILFFQDRSSAAASHSLGGGGNLTLLGTIYITNTLALMKANAAQYQSLTLQGNSGSSTLIKGEIIASSLALGGTPNITMNLNPNATLHIRQVALVK
jgi:hypothetical protein